MPGGDFGSGGLAKFRTDLANAYPWLDQPHCHSLLRRHGSRIHELLDGARDQNDLGQNFGGNLTEREVEWFRRHEWANSADDILWRRSKCGLHMSVTQREAFADYITASTH